MEKIHIGLLLPSSSILPVSKDFENGLKEALKNAPGLEIELTKAFIGMGGSKQTEDACSKFFSYDEVDLVTGIVSNMVVQAVAEKFAVNRVPFIVNNPGGHAPDLSKLNEYIFINSYHLWRHAWILGNWGVKTFGKKGMYVSATYDAGYSFSSMFYQGMMAADPTSEWSFSVPPVPPKGAVTDMSIIFPFLEQYQPDFVFATFCGNETTHFLNEFISSGWDKRTVLTGLPFLLSPFSPVTDDMTVYSTRLDLKGSDVNPGNSFYYLGYHTGMAIVEAALNSDGSSIQEQLKKINELLWCGTHKDDNFPRTTVMKNVIMNGSEQIRNEIIAEHAGVALNDVQLPAGQVAGWMNPYLCV